MILTDPDQRTMNVAVARIQAALRFQLTVPAIIQNSRRDVSPRIRETISALPANHYAMTIPAFVHDAGYWDKNEDLVMQKCLITLAPQGLISTGIMRLSVLTHETFHCYQYEMAGSLSSAFNRTPWVFEGSAMFVGEDLIPETSTVGVSYFNKYTRDVQNIFNRSYDAYPFFLHLKIAGADVYQIFRKFFTGGNDNAKLWQDIVSTAPPEALITWATSLAYKPEWGFEWDLQFRDYRPIQSSPFPVDPSEPVLTPFPQTNVFTATLPLSAPGFMGIPRHDKVLLEPNKYVKLSVEHGMAGIFYRTEDAPEGRTFYLLENKQIQFCYGEYCDCIDTQGSVETIKVSDPIVFMASVSTTQNHTVHFEEGHKSCCNNEGDFDPRLVGTWNSNINRFLEIWGNYPYDGGIKENSGTGNIKFVIGRRGEFIKKYQGVNFHSTVTKGRNVSTTDFSIKSEFAGCLKTRPTGEAKGWLFLSEVIDQVSWTEHTQHQPNTPRSTARGHQEYILSSVCNGDGTSAKPCRGTYHFDGNKLTFDGIGNGVYPDMEKEQ